MPRFVLALFAATLCACDPTVAPMPDGGDASVADSAIPDDASGCPAVACPAARPVCDTATAMCVECLDAADCSDPAAPLCIRSACAPCLNDAQCVEQMSLPLCRGDGTCAECERVSDCPAARPICDGAGLCVECLSDAACSDGAPDCAAGVCTSCLVTRACTPEQLMRELLTITCEEGSEYEGESSLGDAFLALFCSGHPDLSPFLGALLEAVRSGRLAVDDDVLAACIASGGLTGGLLGEDCPGLFVPTVTPGGLCAIDAECTTGACAVPAGACGGTCASDRGPGVNCTRDEECLAGDFCIGSVCTTPPARGEACTTRCAEALTCVGGTCIDPPPIGAACTGTCAVDAYCNGSGVCAARRTAGQSCRGDVYSGDCGDGLYCIARVCSTLPPEGAACRPDFVSPRCGTGLRCAADVCTAPMPAGAACTVTQECELGDRCVASVCRTILGVGDECAAGDACPLGMGCHDGRCRPLPDVGQACFTAGCFRGVCRGGLCSGQGSLTSCPAGPYYFDVLDPCGNTASCTESGAGWICVVEGNEGATCVGTDAVPCRAPDTFCNASGACEAYCEAP